MSGSEIDKQAAGECIGRPKLELHVDVSITRRKRYQMVTEPGDRLLFKSKLVQSALEFIEPSPGQLIDIVTPSVTYSFMLIRSISTRKD